MREFCFLSEVNVQETRFSSFSELFDASEDKTLPTLERRISTLSGGLAEANGEDKDVVLIHQSVKDFLIKDGFQILDPEQNTHQKVMASGHSLLLSSYLWWLSEVDMSEIAHHWLNTFDPAIIAIVMSMVRNSDNLGPFKGLECDITDSIRGTVDSLSSSDREAMRAAMSGQIETCDSWSAHYRESIVAQGPDGWLVSDEIYACLVLFGLLLQKQLSFMASIYAVGCWMHHALGAADNGGLSRAKSEIRQFCSRLKIQHATIHNRIFGVLHQAAGLRESWVLEELLSHVSKSPLDVNSMCGKYGITPLMHAIGMGRDDNIRILLEHKKIDLNAKNLAHQTALFDAYMISYELVERLIKHGADVDKQNNEGTSLLMRAVYDDKYEIMNLLLENGASVHLKTPDGLDAIDFAEGRCLGGLARFIIRKIRRQEREIWGDG